MKPRLPLYALLLALPACAPASTPYLRAPAVQEYARFEPFGTTILGDGRLLEPLGRPIAVGRWPHGMAISPDGGVLFVASQGVGQIITGWQGADPQMREIPQTRTRAAVGGAAFSPDGRLLYWSGGDTGTVGVYDVATGGAVGEIALNGPAGGRAYADSFAMDLRVSADGKLLFCADVTNFRVAVVDTRTREVVGSVPVGRYPYALAVSGATVYVANIGLFEYAAVPAPADGSSDKRGLTFPPYGYPSKEAREGVEVEGRRIPGLGDPNAPESYSVWGIDAADPARPRVVTRVKTGLLVGAQSDAGKTVGGSGPNYVLARGRDLYVSNGNNDTVERFDARTGRRAFRARLQPSPLTARLRGVGPSGMALSPDGRRLYVAESGINAIAVLDARSGKTLGHLPTAWYPYRLALSADGKRLACACFRGFGNGPSAGAARKEIEARPDGSGRFLDMKGVVMVLDAPPDRELPALTARVLTCNGMVDRASGGSTDASSVVPRTAGEASAHIKHVVFITKENHTYDAVFDRVPGASDDPALLRWGLHQTLKAEGQPTLEDVAVMANHNALARQFTVSDNFYMQPEFSGVGHRWLVGVQPNNFCQMTYTLGWDFKAATQAPGRRASFGSNGSLAPEDYPEAGSMWEHLARHGVPFRNYGEGFEFAGVEEGEDEHRTGAREVVNIPMPKVLYDSTCRDYPIFNMNIPDQYRAYWFEQDFRKRSLDGKGQMPAFVNIAICNDHGASPNAKGGYPYVASWMADNDLALGRIVEFLSHTPYWREMAIFVTEDDSGGEPDHVDAQRSVLLVISPWARRSYVSHRHATILSMHRTLYEILGLPSLNMFDALANDLSDCFTDAPDFRPYAAASVDPRVFDPEKAKDPKDPDYRQARLRPSIARDDPDDMEDILREGEREGK